jgi:hypothetical protein
MLSVSWKLQGKLSLSIACKVGQTFVLTQNVLSELSGAVLRELDGVVSSSEIFVTSVLSAKLGVNGAEILFCPRADQSNSCEERHPN